MDKEETINKLIGTRILTFRKIKKLSRTKLAEILNITQQQLDKYEKGINRISAAKLAIISEKFKIDISYFYSDLLLDIFINDCINNNSDNYNNNNKTTVEKEKYYKYNKENINKLLSYYLCIKKEENKNLVVELTKELCKISSWFLSIVANNA